MKTEGKIELGRIEEIFRYLVHIEVDPIRKGLLIKELYDEHGMKLSEIAKRTGWSLSRISELYRAVTELHPALLERVLKGEIRASTALELSKLPSHEQEKFVNVDKVTLKMVEDQRRDYALSEAVKEIIDFSIDIPDQALISKPEVRCPFCGRRFIPE